ncbi:receptor-like serine/threonine-protein kinase ALE2-like, partial [Trifolium medium]|nr:receptor-like serine/threonine-protein kinase ALE2-like [Trifolium medium]
MDLRLHHHQHFGQAIWMVYILILPSLSPRISPLGSSLNKIKTPPPAYTLVLPPPPPNKDCLSVTCLEPLTYTPPGSPCGCVWPLQ